MAPSTKFQYTRSGQMVSALREAFLYSEKRSRDYVFLAAETVLENAEAMPTLAQLTRTSLDAARAHAESVAYDLANSETVTRAVFNAMLRAGVLLGVRGNRVIAGCAAQAARVTALAADFRDATEAFLLEFLITALADVTARDHIALAHALFRQFDPGIPVADLEDRVVGLLAKLSDHVILGEDGIYRVYRGPANRTVRFA